MRLPIIDADGHVMEPFSLWQERLPERYRDVAWRRQAVDGAEVVTFYGHDISFEWSLGSLCTPGGLSAGGRLDIDLDAEVDPGVHEPRRRLELMDAQGIAASVLFPTMTLGLDDLPDHGFVAASAHAYNEWIRDFAAADPRRLRWAAVLPLVDLAWARDELAWALGEGATTVMLSPIPTPSGQSLGSRALDPIWADLVAAGRPAVVHASNPASPTLGLVRHLANRAQWQMGVPFQLQLAVMHVVDGGVLERFPDLRMGFFEGDVGWLPHWLGRLDETYAKMALVAGERRRSALEQFRDQCVISGEPADVGLALTAGTVGADHVLWASDWPHQDGAWPDPVEILRDRDDLDGAAKRAMFVDGAAGFFGIHLPDLMAHLGPGWDPDAPVAGIGGMLGATRRAVGA
ncbi:MAG: amidohydrolase family protein [Acidimicrobiales bacterium]